MTNGILESINTKDKLYKIFIQADKPNVDRFNILKSDYQAYRARLRKTIREAKRMFYARTFLMYKNDIKKTWGMISDTLKRNRKSKSQAEFIYENHVIRDTDEIANHFHNYFINIYFIFIFIYTTFIQRSIHKPMCSNALLTEK